MTKQGVHSKSDRPIFPKRAVITAGMPYGNKRLHFGHIGGVFAYADIYARFLKDRIGQDNVLFVSGTDGFGSPIVESHREKVQSDQFAGNIEEFVKANHDDQEATLKSYNIGLDTFPTSSLGHVKKVHEQTCADMIEQLKANGHLKKMVTKQFYDTEVGAFLNGRQVVGRCPILNCPSEKAYADECSLGHQFMPHELEHPKSTLSGTKPEMRDVANWFIDLASFRPKLKQWVESIQNDTKARALNLKTISEFFEPPIIHVKKDQFELLEGISDQLPAYQIGDGQTKAIRLVFNSLEDREAACSVLTRENIRYRTGKTLVPFRLTGNIEWGLPVPSMDGLEGLTWWVWPESLVAPISFTKALLEEKGAKQDEWKSWWCSEDAKIYQFIGEDNIYFYGIAEIAMFLGAQGSSIDTMSVPAPEGQLQLPELVVNNHILFLDKKASSSGKIKPPMASDLLDHYTSDQLRAHFISLGLGLKSVSFRPKPYNPKANEKEADPVLKEGNLLSNVLNRLIRSCFYTLQKYYDSIVPVGAVSDEIKDTNEKIILGFEALMAKGEFHLAMAQLDKYIRECSKYWTRVAKLADENDDVDMRRQLVIDGFEMMKVAVVLMHPIAPEGTELVRDYLKLDETLWSWEHIFKSLTDLMADPAKHQLKFLEPRIDFFPKHESQLPKH